LITLKIHKHGVQDLKISQEFPEKFSGISWGEIIFPQVLLRSYSEISGGCKGPAPPPCIAITGK